MIKPMPSPTLTLRWMACLAVLLPLPCLALAAADDEAPRLWALKPVVRPDVPTGLSTSPNPIDAFIAAGYQAQGPEAGRSGRQEDLAPPRLPRPDRASADARRTGRLSPGPVAGRLREGGRPAPRQRAARRPLRPALARRPALCRRRRADDRRARHLSLARLGDQRAQRRPALRPVRPRAVDRDTGRRPGPRCRAPASAAGWSPGPTISSRSGSSPAATSSARQERPGTADRRRRDGLHRLHGPDRRLRQVPRPHVRSDHAARLLRHEGAVRSAGGPEGDAGDPGGDLRQRQGDRRGRSEASGPRRADRRADRSLPEEAPRRPRRDAARRTCRPSSASRRRSARPPSRRSPTTTSRCSGSTPARSRRSCRPPSGSNTTSCSGSSTRLATAAGASLPAFWTVEVDPKRALEKSYILTSGDPDRPEKDHEVEPGWPFAPPAIDFREGRIEAFSDWLTAPENPLFARVAVNRLWQWHFGEGLHRTPSDFRPAGRDARRTRRSSTGWPPSSSRAASA